MKADAPYSNIKEFTEAARASARQVQLWPGAGHHRVHLLGYLHDQKLEIAQVPYRDINVAPVDLGEGRIQVVMSSYAIVQPQIQAGRIKLFIVNNKTRDRAGAGHADRARARLSVARSGRAGRAVRAEVHVERAEGEDRRRLPRGGRRRQHRRAAQATGQVINVGGPKEFAEAIEEQRRNIAEIVKAIDFKPKNR